MWVYDPDGTQGATTVAVANTEVVDGDRSDRRPNSAAAGGGDVASEDITLDFDGADGALLKASGTVDIGLFGFVYLSGDFAFAEEHEAAAFVGVNGPATTRGREVDAALARRTPVSRC